MIFIVETKEGSGVQAEDQDDSGSTQQTTWDPGFWEELENTGTPLPEGAHRVWGLWASTDHQLEESSRCSLILGGREALSQPLSTHWKVRRQKENVVWLHKRNTNYSHLCKLLSIRA